MVDSSSDKGEVARSIRAGPTTFGIVLIFLPKHAETLFHMQIRESYN